MTDLRLIVDLWNSALIDIALVGVAGIVVWHVIPRRFVDARLIIQIGFFLLMSAMLVEQQVFPFATLEEPGETIARAALIGSVKLLWWLHLAWALIGFVRIYLVLERRPREARLLQDLVVGAVYAGVLLSILAFVFSIPVGTLIATSGVLAIILGLALQNTLGDVFSGIALDLGRPYVLGDYIMLSDGTEGRVIETDWRSTHLLTLANNVVVLPNSFLARLGVTNVSSPDESHGLSLVVRLAPTMMPAIIIDVMRLVLLSCTAILKDPPPSVAIRSMDAAAIEVELFFRVADVHHRLAARTELLDLLYRHAAAAGVRLGMPSFTIAATVLPTEEAVKSSRLGPIDLIRAMPLFLGLTEDEREALAAAASLHTYRTGEIVVRQGDTLSSLMIVRSGVLQRQRDDGNGPVEELGRLAPGDCFGESGLLTGMGETPTVRAMSHVEIYEINQRSFAPLLLDRPEMAEDLAAILSADLSPVGESSAAGQPHAHSRSALLQAIHAAYASFRATALKR